MNEGSFALTRKGHIALCNPRVGEMLGMPGDQVVGQQLLDLIPEPVRAQVHTLVENGWANGSSRGEAQITAAQSRPIPVLLSFFKTTINGSPHLGGVVSDLTEHARAEQDLAFQARLLAHVHDAVIATDDQFRIVYWNHIAQEMYGWTADQVRGRDVQEVLRPLLSSAERAALREEMAHQGYVRFETIHHRKDGHTIHVAGTRIPLRNGRVTGHLLVHHDITARKRAEAILKESEERFAKAFHASPAAIIITRLSDGRILDINDSFLQVMGYQRAEVLGRTSVDLGLWVDPEDRPRLVHQLQSGQPVRDVEVKMRVKGGAVRIVTISAELIELDGERSILSAMKDITHRRQQEEEIRALNAELERRVAERTAQVERANELLVNEIFERRKLQEAAQQNERRVTEILESIQDGFFTLDRDWRFTYVNTRAASNVGHSPDDLIGQNVWEMFPHMLGTPVEAHYRKAMTERVPQSFEIRGVLTDTIYDVRVYPSADGISVYCRDITERRRAESALQRQETVLAQAGEVAHLGAWEIEFRNQENLNANPLIWSDEVYRIFGYAPGPVAVTNDLFFERVHPDDRQRVSDAVAHAMTTRRPYSIEHRIIRPDGTERTVLEHAEIYFDDQGQPARMVGAVQDITERKQAEEAVRLSQEDLNRAQAVAQTGSWRMDVQRNVLLWSDETYRMFAIPKRTPMTYEAFLAAVHPDDRDKVDQAWRAALQGAPYDIEHRIVVNGGVKWVRERAELEFDPLGNLRGGFGTVQDITERKQAEEKIESLARFPAENPNPIFRLDSQGILVYANGCGDSLLEKWGAAVGGPAPGFLRKLARKAQSANETCTADIEVLDRSYSFSVVPVITAGYVNLYGRDITERTLAEERIQQLNRDLERRATELQVANNELDAFAYSVSHDLRTPLASLDGLARLVVADYGPLLPPDAQRFLELIQASARTMDRLIEDLLTFSRTSRQPLNKQPVEPLAIVRQVIEELRSAEPTRTVEVVVGELPPFLADPGLLKRVWFNLLSNAWKFTRHAQPPRIEVGVRMEEGEIVYFVRDNGVGFDMNHAEKLFGVFQRLHGEEEFEGTGVGLAIAARIVHRHGGRIWAEAKVGTGATFCFTLGHAE